MTSFIKIASLFIYISSILTLVYPSKTQSAPVNLLRNTLGESRVPIDLKNFHVTQTNPQVQVNMLSESLVWERNLDNLLTPKVLIRLIIPESLKVSIILQNTEKIFPSTTNSGLQEITLWMDLFNPSVITLIGENNKILDAVSLESQLNQNPEDKTILIDYSCSPYLLSITGLEGEYASLGCVHSKIGKLGEETSRLDVTFSTTNLVSMSGEKPPFKIILNGAEESRIQLKNSHGLVKNITIKANLPKRYHRLKTALGFGPYAFKSRYQNFNHTSDVAPSLMLYGKYEINESSSFKFFDAALYQKSFFNNAGFYYSYDLAEAFDGRVVFNALLGLQVLHYRFDSGRPKSVRYLYPQGFEVLWKHPFDFENHYVTYGMFLTTSSVEDYTNAWLRWGKKVFWELNYIQWKYDVHEISMWGLSVGIPLFQAI